jgi:hypothetical protein
MNTAELRYGETNMNLKLSRLTSFLGTSVCQYCKAFTLRAERVKVKRNLQVHGGASEVWPCLTARLGSLLSLRQA